MSDTMRSQTKSLLAQLTLVGAAALTGSNADAQIIVTNVNKNIGYAPGDMSKFVSSLPGIAKFVIARTSFQWRPSVSSQYVRTLAAASSNPIGFGHGARIKANGIVDKIVPGGKVWNTISGSSSGFILNVNNNVPGLSTPVQPTFIDQYLAFKFVDTANSDQTDYGWIKLSLTDNTYSNMNVTIDSYAYDASGAQLPTGATSYVPEPSPVSALAALSALSLGAVGVRRLKALQIES